MNDKIDLSPALQKIKWNRIGMPPQHVTKPNEREATKNFYIDLLWLDRLFSARIFTRGGLPHRLHPPVRLP